MTAPPSGLHGLALSRAAVDRRAERRAEPGLLDALLADPATAVAVLAGHEILVEEDAGATAVALLAPGSLPEGLRAAALPLFLGEDDAGRAYVALAVPPGSADAEGLVGGALRFANLREIGSLLDDAGAGSSRPRWRSGTGTRCTVTARGAERRRTSSRRAGPGAARTAGPSTSPAPIRR